MHGEAVRSAAADCADVTGALLAILDLLRTGVPEPPAAPEGLDALVVALHRTNAALWDAEDDARRPGAEDAVVGRVKRHIDVLNLERHRGVERIDDFLIEVLPVNPDAELHTETIGMIVDRVSILTLREFHVSGRIRAGQVPLQNLEIIRRQRRDLLRSLELLLNGCAAGTRRFVTYRALKMYGVGDGA